ncbi:sensor histidine kinase [Fulvivirga lutea]|uniref:histidine kinase n=1 Tax=Fulvivirga lutea TaxID=2810512 RepID=A0A974WJT1_9BACT|nr:ATP-binding protein [Fulvivirga lutea]QSE97460.1 GHKL domain-containing protein [Fulvivirga lutea]
MDFSDLKKNALIRVGLLTLTLFIFCYTLFNNGFIITQAILIALAGLQVASMIKFLSSNKQENEDVRIFLQSLSEDVIKKKYPINTDNPNLNALHAALNKFISNNTSNKREKEADFQYLKNIVQHIGIGIITFKKDGTVQICNSAAKKLLRTENLKNIHDLKTIDPLLVDTIIRLRTGGRDLVKIELNGEIFQLAIYAIELTLRGEVYKLISLQNIQSELEEKEMEAWQNLVRVLTHEIMNSVTPISSLANTVDQELQTQLANGKEMNQMSNDEVEDLHLALQTIKKRSEGLIKFVQDFRNLTQVATPTIKEIAVAELIDDILLLLKKEIENNQIQIHKNIAPDLTIKADRHMIEQVLINIIKNATQAFDEQANRLIQVTAELDEKKRPVISIRDNGNGIEEEALQKIFIPFFTTKKDGSGIGLSLSRQIMRKHQGSLSVKSQIDEGTEFFLRF